MYLSFFSNFAMGPWIIGNLAWKVIEKSFNLTYKKGTREPCIQSMIHWSLKHFSFFSTFYLLLSLIFLSAEEQALGSATLCVSWLQSWGTWFSVLLSASRRRSPSSWPRLCSSAEAWLHSGCQTPGRTSSCNTGSASISWDKTWIKPGWIREEAQVVWGKECKWLG